MNNNNCKNRREEVAAFVLGELETEAAKKLKEHIDTCETCRSLYQSLTDEEQIIQSAFEVITQRGKNIENQLVSQYRKISGKQPSVPYFGASSIAARRILKIVAAAVIIIAISIFTWFNRQKAPTEKVQFASGLNFLSKACAAEQALFSTNKITHILNEIVVYPTPEEKPSSELLDKLNLSPEKRKYLETVNSWLDYNWLPLCSLQANGEFRFNQLTVSKDFNQSYIITDEAWYHSATGYFARVMKTEDKVIFANSYDGRYIYFSETDAAGSIRLLSEKVREGFTPPQNPAEFLGITAGLQSSIQKDDFQPPVLEVTQETLNDGTPVNTYKLGFVDLLGQADTYWLFRVRDDNIVAEMEFVLAGSSQLLMQRVLSETVDKPEMSWDLTQIDLELQKSEESPRVAVTPDVYRSISIQHMIDNAGFETYIFGVTASWTQEPEIGDIDDFANPGKRMFIMVYEAVDERHLILCQSETFNSFFSSTLKWAQQHPIYTSSNGFKVWHGGPEKWWTEFHIRSCGFIPAEDRSGYVFESPTGTFTSLAINGQLTDKELVNLVDSLVPAKKVLELSSDELQDYIENLPPGKFGRQSDPLQDPNNGMQAMGLTKEQAMVKIAEEYWNAIINEDWDYVAKLRPVASAEFWKDKYSKNPVLELTEVGQPYKPQLPCSGLLVPCIVKLEDGKTVEKTLVVRYRIINGQSSCIIPAMWGKTRIIE